MPNPYDLSEIARHRRDSTLTPGWLGRQLNRIAIDAATPPWMRDSSEDARLTESQRKEAARILRGRADELDPPEATKE